MAGAARGAAEVADCDGDPEVAFSRASVTAGGVAGCIYCLSLCSFAVSSLALLCVVHVDLYMVCSLLNGIGLGE